MPTSPIRKSSPQCCCHSISALRERLCRCTNRAVQSILALSPPLPQPYCLQSHLFFPQPQRPPHPSPKCNHRLLQLVDMTTLSLSSGNSYSPYDYDAKARMHQTKTASQAQGGLAGPDEAAFLTACAKGRYKKLFILGYPLIIYLYRLGSLLTDTKIAVRTTAEKKRERERDGDGSRKHLTSWASESSR